MKGVLILENGHFFVGEQFGCEISSTVAEVVFNTGMVGYQEVMTDPSYKGQIVVMTYPLMGNYGLNSFDNESSGPAVSGFIVKEAASYPSNWRYEESLDDYLKEHKIAGLKGIDTRKLTRILREKGTMKGMIVPYDDNLKEYQDKLSKASLLANPVSHVTTKESYVIPGDGKGKRIVVMDFGVKKSILDNLSSLGLELVVVPSDTCARDIMRINPDGLFLSNGPGDPKDVLGAVQTVKELQTKLPVFGICLGLQILALSLGGDTYKLKFGHRGINHPVKDLIQGRVHITSQNHGYAVEEDSLPADITVTHVNLNDGTVEGFKHQELPLMAVQYHPESSPGPLDSQYLFENFLQILKPV